MKLARIRQLEKIVRSLQADSYKVLPEINNAKNRLMIVISLKGEEGEEIMAQWNDLRKVGG